MLRAVCEDKGVDGVLFISIFASANLEVVKEVVALIEEMGSLGKPVLSCLSAPPGIWEEEISRMDGKKGFCVLKTPERAARAMANLFRVSSLIGEG